MCSKNDSKERDEDIIRGGEGSTGAYSARQISERTT